MRYEDYERVIQSRGSTEFWTTHRLVDDDELTIATTGRAVRTTEKAREFGPLETRLSDRIYFSRQQARRQPAPNDN